MPYSSKSDLTDKIKDNLPDHAQDIYKEAFNSAYDQYGEDERAARVAWSAVKEKYEKQNGKWTKKINGKIID